MTSNDCPHVPASPPPPLAPTDLEEIREWLQTCSTLLLACRVTLIAIERQQAHPVVRHAPIIIRNLPEREMVRLSRREHDVLLLIAEGLNNTEIGAELNLSPGTVKNHITSILAKLGARNRWEGVAYAQKLDLL